MKNKSIVLSLLAIAVLTIALTRCALLPQEKSQFCMTLDAKSEFTRCETAEVVCYLSKASQSCYVKPPGKSVDGVQKSESKK